MSLKKQNHLTKSWVWVCVLLCVSLTCRVLQTKSLLSSPHTLWAATTNTITRNTKTMDNQILPKAVEYLFTPLTRLSSPDQFITAAVLVQEIDTSEPCTTEQREKNTHTPVIFNRSLRKRHRYFCQTVSFPFLMDSIWICFISAHSVRQNPHFAQVLRWHDATRWVSP